MTCHPNPAHALYRLSRSPLLPVAVAAARLCEGFEAERANLSVNGRKLLDGLRAALEEAGKA